MTKERLIELILQYQNEPNYPGKNGEERLAEAILYEQTKEGQLDIKPHFTYHTYSKEDFEHPHEEEVFEWPMKETAFPLTAEYAYLKQFTNFLVDNCGIKDAEVYLEYYLGNITTEENE